MHSKALLRFASNSAGGVLAAAKQQGLWHMLGSLLPAFERQQQQAIRNKQHAKKHYATAQLIPPGQALMF
jgi:hypothetical protein